MQRELFRDVQHAAGCVVDHERYDYEADFLCGLNQKFLLFRDDGAVTVDLEMAKVMAGGIIVDSPNKAYGTIPPEFVSASRLFFGLFFLLGRLHATANWRKLFLDLVESHIDVVKPTPDSQESAS